MPSPVPIVGMAQAAARVVGTVPAGGAARDFAVSDGLPRLEHDGGIAVPIPPGVVAPAKPVPLVVAIAALDTAPKRDASLPRDADPERRADIVLLELAGKGAVLEQLLDAAAGFAPRERQAASPLSLSPTRRAAV